MTNLRLESRHRPEIGPYTSSPPLISLTLPTTVVLAAGKTSDCVCATARLTTLVNVDSVAVMMSMVDDGEG